MVGFFFTFLRSPQTTLWRPVVLVLFVKVFLSLNLKLEFFSHFLCRMAAWALTDMRLFAFIGFIFRPCCKRSPFICNYRFFYIFAQILKYIRSNFTFHAIHFSYLLLIFLAEVFISIIFRSPFNWQFFRSKKWDPIFSSSIIPARKFIPKRRWKCIGTAKWGVFSCLL